MYLSLLYCVVQGADLWAKDKMGHNARYLAFSRHHVRTVTHLDNALYMHRLDSGEGDILSFGPCNSSDRWRIFDECYADYKFVMYPFHTPS